MDPQKLQSALDLFNKIGLVLAESASPHMQRWNSLQAMVEFDQALLDKADIRSAASSLLSTVQGQVASNPDASAALAQLGSLMDVAMDQASLAQDTTMPTQASTAATTQGTTMTSAGPTITDPNTTKAATTAPTTAPSSTPGKSTPTALESDTVKAQTTALVPTQTTPSASTPQSPSSILAANKGDTVQTDSVQKGDFPMSDQPAATTPPLVNLDFGGENVTDKYLPSFISALADHGSRRAAEGVIKSMNGGVLDPMLFDEMSAKSQKYLLDKGGWNHYNYTHDERYRKSAIGMTDNDLKKAISIGDVPNIYLIRLAKLMIPLYAGLGQRIPTTRPPTGGSAAQWRTEIGAPNFNVAFAMATSEGSPGLAISESFVNFSVPFRRIAIQDKVYLEAVYGAQGFDDPLQIAVLRGLTLLLRTKENKLLGDNAGSLAAPSGVSVTAASTGGGTLGSNTNGSIYVTALTQLGYQYYLSTGSIGQGYGETTAGSTTIASAGSTYGSAITWTATWPAIKGAVAYAVYAGSTTGSTNMFFSKVSTIGSVTIGSIGTVMPFPGTDSTTGSNSYEGLIAWAEKQSLYSNTGSVNRAFTDQSAGSLSTYAGGISEFDSLLSTLWTSWQAAPSLIVCSPNSVKHLTKQLLSTSQTSAYRIEVGQERGTITGGAFVTGYVNKFAPWADGLPRIIDIMAHPYMADGKFVFMTERVSFPIARENRGFAVEQLIPYTYFPLAQSDISYPFSMLCSEALECFFWPGQAAITNVNVAL